MSDNFDKGLIGELEAEVILETEHPQSKVERRIREEDPKSKVKREIDLKITSNNSDVFYAEVRKRNEKADIGWIDQISGKYQNYNYNKVYAVADQPFTSYAINQTLPNVNIKLIKKESGPISKMMKVQEFEKAYSKSLELGIKSFDFKINNDKTIIINDRGTTSSGRFKYGFDPEIRFSNAYTDRNEQKEETIEFNINDIPFIFDDGTEGLVTYHTEVKVIIYDKKFIADEGTIVRDAKNKDIIALMLKFKKKKKYIAYCVYNVKNDRFLVYVDTKPLNFKGFDYFNTINFTTPNNILEDGRKIDGIIKLRLSIDEMNRLGKLQ